MKMSFLRSKKVLVLVASLLLPFVLSGCDTISGTGKSGVILAKTAQIRSSYAVVAADLLEVHRGDVVEILDDTEVTDQNREDQKERWLQVRITKDDQETEGWIEARNVITEDFIEQSGNESRLIVKAQMKKRTKK